ncbi:MAG: HAD family hydrolase [Clostridia bacterium]|jgi:Cof subfamily protein (haloacid dehalogenase superfamily)
MFRMVVTDLDETLLRTDKTISPYTMDVIHRVRKQGIKVIFATARGNSARALVPYEMFDGYVLLNGAKAYMNNRLIYDQTISSDVFTPFLQALSNKSLKAAAEIEGVHYANFNVKQQWSCIDNFVITDYVNVQGRADKLYVVIEDRCQIDLIASILPPQLYLHVSRDNLVMIMHREATKCNGILELAKHFKISKREIVAFGDAINDKEMLQCVGFGVAVGNSIDEIKMITDAVCDTNDNDGVAKWLGEYVG